MASSASGGSGISAPAVSGRADPLPPGRAARDRRRLSRRVLGGAIIVALAIVSLTALMLWRLQQAQLDEGLNNLSALDLLVAAQTERAFESVGVVLDDVSADLQAQSIASAEALRQAAGNEAMFRLLRAKMAGIAQLNALAIVTSDGDVINRTRSYPVTTQTNVADREYFTRLRDHPELKAFISPPLEGADGNTMIYVGKRLNAPNGAFIGIVLAALRAHYFEDLYSNYLRALPGEGKSMALWRSDGTLLSRSPAETDPIVDATSPDLARPMPSNGLLSYWTAAPHDNTIGIAQRRLDDLPLTIEVRQSASAMLAPWSGQFLATGIGGGALLLLVGAAVWLLMRQLRTQALIIEERARANREAEAREDIERARMKAEAAMRDAQQSEARFRDIAEVGSDWIWETDAAHRFTLIAGARQPKVSLIGKTRWEQAGRDPETDPFWREHKAVLDAHQPFRQFRFATQLPAGQFHVCVSGKPIFADDGSFVGYRGTVSDETELVETRERAMRADSLLHNAIESIAEGFVIYDAEDRFVMCNEAYRTMYKENARFMVPGTKYEDIMRAAVATGRYSDAKGHEEEWLAAWMHKHRNPGPPEESQLTDGRWVLRSERRMGDGGIAGLRIDITALKQAQEALRENQVMLNRAQRLSGTGSAVRNLKTDMVEWSDEMYHIFGLERGGITPGPAQFRTYIHPEDRDQVPSARKIALEGQDAAPVHFRIVRPDGDIRWVYREIELVRDAAGELTSVLTTYKDATDKHEADMRQRELEVLLHGAIESISEGFVIYDKDDRLVICNEGYRRIYSEIADIIAPGVHFADILRAQLARGHRPEVKGREEKWIADMIRRRRSSHEPHEVQMRGGRWILVFERPMSNGGLAGLRIDITELKRVQQSLRDSQQRLDRTQRIAHIGTVERDLRTNNVVWSDETYRIFGVDPATYTPSADNFSGFVHPEDRSLVLDVRGRRHYEHANSSLRFRIMRPSGETRVILSQADVTYDDAGQPLYISIALMDITEKEQASQRQIELEMQLRHSEKLTALGTLAGGIAHDLNNTLVPIQALSKLVMREFPADAPSRGDLETIHQASIQARDLVRQILAFSRKQELLNEPTDIAARLREALQMLRASVPSTIEIVERITPIELILADGTQLQQVIVNLVANSAHAIGDDYGRVTVTLDEVPGEPGAARLVRISVADNGRGMSPDIMHRMFEPFFTTKSVGEGTGLGLSVVHGIVTSHGGTIDVKSTPGQGTEFIILMPAKPVDESSAIAAVA